jgi:hypothetical protein
MDLSRLSKEVFKLEGILEKTNQEIDTLNKNIDLVNEELKYIKESIDLAKKCLERNNELKKDVEYIISTGLSETFDKEYKFILDLSYNSQNVFTGFKPKLSVNNGPFLSDILESFGAGPVIIISILFRLAFLLVTNQTRRIVIFDEPFANLALDLQIRLKAFVMNLCNESKIQLIMTTHMTEPFGKVYKVIKDKKEISRVVEE